MRAPHHLFAKAISAKRVSAARCGERQLTFSFDASEMPRIEVPREIQVISARRRDPDELRAAIASTLGISVELELTRNRRTMISSTRAPGRLVVRLHEMFVDAGGAVMAALCSYLKNADRDASRVLGAFIEAHRGCWISEGPPPRLRTRGDHHDLSSTFARVGNAYFPGALQGVEITWGKRGASLRGTSRRSIRLGTYTLDERLIRIHPVLDQSWVPPFFVEYIVFHEMLHHVEPAREEGSRTIFHTPEFRRRERAYPDYIRALEWERVNIDKLLRATR